MATTPPYAYPFDPTGTSAANKITGEQQVITPANYRDFHYIVPRFAPFFADGLVVKFRDASNVVRTLVEGQDYYCTHWFIAASRACAKAVYGSISFLNNNLAGTVIYDYQTLGGMWTQDLATITQILGDLIHNPRITAWDVVVDMPVTFPVIDHQWDLTDLVGGKEVVQALSTIEVALRQTGQGGLTDHMIDFSNPHRVTAAQVGLGSVANYPMADGPTTIAGSSSQFYVSPFGLKQALDAGPNAAIGTHAGRNDNPHQVTAAQVGAYSQVQTNTLLASKLNTTGVAYDTSRFDGLSPTEYRDWALSTGVAANSLKFGGLTFGEAKANILSGQSADSAQLQGHSYAQVIAAAQAAASTATDTQKFNGLTYAQAKADILSGQAADSGQLEGKNFAAVMLAVSNATVANSLKLGGMTAVDYKADVLTGTAANSTQFGGMTPGQWETHLGTVFGAPGMTAPRGAYDFSVTDALGSYWHLLGTCAMPTDQTKLANTQDLIWLIAGGDSANSRYGAIRLLHLSLRAATTDGVGLVALANLTGQAGTGQIGYTVGLRDNGTGTQVLTCSVYIKTSQNNGAITCTELAKGAGKLYGTATSTAVLTAEPAGITYFAETLSGLASAAALTQLRTDVEQSLTDLTTAFTTLKAQVDAS